MLPAATFAGGALSGVKPGVTAGLQADFAIVWAAHEGRPALVFAELGGVSREAIDSFDNSRGYADLAFAGAPATLLLQGEAASNAARDILARMAVVAAHEQVGGAEAMMLTARDYANTRKAFGQPIGAFQSVKHRIAELYGLVEVARANCLHAASCEGSADFLKAAAAARLSATEAYDAAARDGVQVHGGIGVTWEAGLHLHMRRARSLAIELGNLFFWEDLLVDELTGASA
jgi:acyl-CoA dehydrogenase